MKLKRKTYKTKRLVLRPYRLTDFSRWAAAYDQLRPKQSKHDWVPPKNLPSSRAQFGKIVKRHNEREREDKVYVWAIFDKKSGALVGHIDIAILTRENLQVANLGYRILNTQWKNGFAAEALLILIPKAFKDLKLNRLEAVIDLDNKPSIKLARRIGLERECIRKKFFYQDRSWADQVVYVAIRELWGLQPLYLSL